MATVAAQYVGLFIYMWLLFGSKRSPIAKEVVPKGRGRVPVGSAADQRAPGIKGRKFAGL